MPGKLRQRSTVSHNIENRIVLENGRTLMKDRAYAVIKQYILQGDLASGSFLAERQLADKLGMSKTPVRAALERLEAEGFVTVSPQQGIIIRELTVHEIADQYEIRAALEAYTVRTLAGKLTSEQIARLRGNLQLQVSLREENDVPRAVALDAEFHTLFCEFLGNREVLRVMSGLRDKIQRVIRKVFQINPGRAGMSYQEHCEIADAVIHGKGAEAARLIELHLERGKRFLLSPRGE
jgi:DNA-binding GntR family transcriptional regulator